MLNISAPNPCANYSCTQMCVLEAQGTAACLCSDGTEVVKNELCPLFEVTSHSTLKNTYD